MDVTDTKAVIFDYGNTIIEFGPTQMAYCYGELVKMLEEFFGDCNSRRLKAIRDRQIISPYKNDLKENHLPTLCGEIIRELYGKEPEDHEISAIMKTRRESFLHVVELSDDTASVLKDLSLSYDIGLLSNYPCGKAIRDSMDTIGITPLFNAIVISGDVGYVKPHPLPFQTVMEALGVTAAECVFVGDNWLADIQGAKRIGMQAVHTTQYVSYESFQPFEGDYEPDEDITQFDELRRILLD